MEDIKKLWVMCCDAHQGYITGTLVFLLLILVSSVIKIFRL
jgi:hypothetical protein